MKLWQKDKISLAAVEKFTVGNDRELDLHLAPFDVLGSIAHVTMLASVGLLTGEEKNVLIKELQKIYHSFLNEGTTLDEGVEDIHSQVELMLTKASGDV